MTVHPLLALLDQPWIIIVIVIAGALFFGAERLPKLARNVGKAKQEFLAGQAEADVAAARAREEARLTAQQRSADVMNNVQAGSIQGEAIPPPTPDKGTPSN